MTKASLISLLGVAVLTLVGWWWAFHGDGSTHTLIGLAGAVGIFLGLFLITWGLVVVPSGQATKERKK